MRHRAIGAHLHPIGTRDESFKLEVRRPNRGCAVTNREWVDGKRVLPDRTRAVAIRKRALRSGKSELRAWNRQRAVLDLELEGIIWTHRSSDAHLRPMKAGQEVRPRRGVRGAGHV